MNKMKKLSMVLILTLLINTIAIGIDILVDDEIIIGQEVISFGDKESEDIIFKVVDEVSSATKKERSVEDRPPVVTVKKTLEEEFELDEFDKRYPAAIKMPKSSLVSDDFDLKFNRNPVTIDGKLYVNLYFVEQSFNVKTAFNKNNGKISITKDSKNIELWIGKNEMIVDSQSVELPAPPTIMGDQVILPLRSISKALNIDVKWDFVSQSIKLISKGELVITAGELIENDFISTPKKPEPAVEEKNPSDVETKTQVEVKIETESKIQTIKDESPKADSVSGATKKK